MKHVIFPGCLISLRLPFIESATRKVLDALEVDYVDSKEFSCCFDPILLKSLSLELWLSVAARNITVAEELGRNILSLCNGCFSTLNEANHYLKEDNELREQVNTALSEIGREFKGTIEVLPLANALLDVGEQKIKELSSKKLESYKAATYHGCHMIWPRKTTGIDSTKSPAILNTLSSWVGAQPVDYTDSPLCCGSGLTSVQADTSTQMLSEILGKMIEHEATHIVTSCPFCFMQFDQRQKDAALPKQLPVLYIAELYQLAFELASEDLIWKYHRVKPEEAQILVKA